MEGKQYMCYPNFGQVIGIDTIYYRNKDAGIINQEVSSEVTQTSLFPMLLKEMM